MKRIKSIESLFIVIIFIVLFIIIINAPTINRFSNKGKLIINEIMASNKNTTYSLDGKNYDYIEIYNGYDYSINLKGYFLSDDSFDLRKWEFPEVTIEPDSYIVVYASGKDMFEEGEIHTNFKLSKSGEVLTLSNPEAKAISRVYFLETMEDTSYGYNGNDYVYFYNPTPNMENNSIYSNEPITSKDSSSLKLYINEYILDNKNLLISKDGNYYPLIEIYNGEKEDINLKDYYISNDSSNFYLYKIPDVTIKSDEYLIIYLSGKDVYEDEEIHTNFKLNPEDKNLFFSDSTKKLIQKVNIQSVTNMSVGLYNNEWHIYNTHSIGSQNTNEYIGDIKKASKDVQINEVTSIGNEAIELKNLTDNDIDLSKYSLGDKSGSIANLPNVILRSNSYVVLYGSDSYSYSNGRVNLGFHINNSNEEIYLYKDNQIIDRFQVGRQTSGVSSGISNEEKRVFYNDITLGKENSNTYYFAYSENPTFSKDGGYVENGEKIKLQVSDGSTIYYTLDGSFPSKNSTKYENEITITGTTVIKAISYKDDLLPSDIVSRTYFVGRKHENAIISISTDKSNLFGNYGILSNYRQNVNKIINFEFYESDGKLGISFLGDTKLSGADSREQPQKSMSIFLRKEYGLKEVTYPFFDDCDTVTYSSFLLRNAGEDPKGLRIMDAVLTRTLKGQMDIDMQEYRPVVVYINGSYYGLYNLRQKLNADYVESVYGIEKDDIDFIKYTTPRRGSTYDYNYLINYVNTHDPANSDVYEYLKTQIDMQELVNYLIVESYYGNTDLGNIAYWKSSEGKWRWMLYDLDWSMWSSTIKMSYPVIGYNVPAATYLYSVINMSRRLYRNSEFRDLYLSTLAYHLKNTFNPDRMNQIVDELAKEIEYEMPYHIERWGNQYSNLNSMNRWQNNINSFKQMITSRYNRVISTVKSDFNLSDWEYEKYFN